MVCCSYETEYEAESQFGSSHNSTAPNVVLVLDAEGEVLDQVVYVSGRPAPHSPRLPAACLKQGWSIRMDGSYTAVSTPLLAPFPPFFRRLFALSGFLASRRRERAKKGVKRAKFGGETAEKQR